MELPQTKQDIEPIPVKFRGTSSFVKAGVGLQTTAVIDLIVSFSTSYWATWKSPEKGEHGGYGLWKIWSCTKHIESDGEVTKEAEICNERIADLWSPFPGWYVTTQVFMSLALAGLVASLIMLLLYIFLPVWHKNKAALSSLIAISYLSGLFIMVSLFVFGFKVAEEIEERHIQEWFLSWSFSLACTSLLLNQISASILITENKRLYTEQNEAQKSQVDSSDRFSGEDDNELIETDNQSSYNQDNLNCVLITK